MINYLYNWISNYIYDLKVFAFSTGLTQLIINGDYKCVKKFLCDSKESHDINFIRDIVNKTDKHNLTPLYRALFCNYPPKIMSDIFNSYLNKKYININTNPRDKIKIVKFITKFTDYRYSKIILNKMFYQNITQFFCPSKSIEIEIMNYLFLNISDIKLNLSNDVRYTIRTGTTHKLKILFASHTKIFLKNKKTNFNFSKINNFTLELLLKCNYIIVNNINKHNIYSEYI